MGEGREHCSAPGPHPSGACSAPPTRHHILDCVSLADTIRQGVLDALTDFSVPGAAEEGRVGAELKRFAALLRDYPERQGKTLRGQLLVLAARAHGAHDENSALLLAEALELFQDWVLVHDDIEDGSEERRGGPALHRQVGMGVALNVGDAMHMLMWRHLARLDERPPLDRRLALAEFTRMLLATAAGQHLDLAWVEAGRFDVSEAEYLRMVTLKTAYYTVASPLTLGAACAGAVPPSGLEEHAIDLGVAFQIRDDVLNLGAAPAYGKEHAGDLYEGKRTLILAHFLRTAPSERRERVVALLARPRAEKTRSEMAEVLTALVEAGSVAYAQAVAEERSAAGLAGISAWLRTLPDQGAARAIEELLAGLTARAA